MRHLLTLDYIFFVYSYKIFSALTSWSFTYMCVCVERGKKHMYIKKVCEHTNPHIYTHTHICIYSLPEGH